MGALRPEEIPSTRKVVKRLLSRSLTVRIRRSVCQLQMSELTLVRMNYRDRSLNAAHLQLWRGKSERNRCLDDPSLNRSGRCLCAIRHFQFFENATDVVSYGIVTNCEGATDLFISKPLGDHLKNFQFAPRQAGSHYTVSKVGGNISWNVTFACVYRSDGLDHLLLRSILQQIALCAGTHRAIDIFICLVASKYNRFRRRAHAPQRMQQINPARPWHSQIEQQHIYGFLL